MKLKNNLIYTLVSLTLAASNAQAQTWANSNITATPTAIYDWFSGGPNTQATWTGGDPVSGSTTTVQFFQDAATALINTVTTGTSQTANLNNGANAFELGTLTLSGKGSAATASPTTLYPHHFEAISGSALNFSGATGTINMNATLGTTGHLGFQVGSNMQLGTASSASTLTLTGGGNGAFFISGNISELQTGGGSLTKSGGSLAILTGNNSYTGTTSVTGGTLRLGSVNALPGGIGATGGTSALTINGGIVELGADDFLRNLGTGASEFQITGGTSGFSTKMGLRNIVVNNDAAQEIQWGSTSFNPSSLVLNGGGGDALLTWQNKINLNGANRTINASGFGERGAAVIPSIISNSAGTAGLTKSGAGVLKLHGANTFNGVVNVSAGTLTINNIADGGIASSLGQSTNAAANLLLSGGTLKYTGAAASSDRAFTLSANSVLEAAGTGALNLTSTATPGYGTNNQARTLSLTGNNPGNNTLAATLADNGTGKVNVTKTVYGTWALTGANTFTGVVTISGGILSINSIADGGSASSLGQSTNAAANLLLASGSTLRYTGAAASSDRSFTINGGAAAAVVTLDASGTGALNLTNAATPGYSTASQNRTLILSGSNTDDNKLSALLTNNTSANTGILVKAGKGTWVLNGSSVNTYTGGTTITTGTLKLDFANLATPADLINNTSALTLGGGTLALVGKDGAASTQAFGNPTFGSLAGSGISIIGGTASTMDLTLGNTWTRNVGSTLNITLGTGGSLTSSPNSINDLIVGSGNIAFATVNGADWAKVDSGMVVAFTSGDYDTSFPDAGSLNTINYSLTGNGSVTATQAANTLKISTTTSGEALTIDDGQILTLSAGGLLFTGAHDYTITGGTFRGSGQTQKNLVIHQFGDGDLTIDSVIANNSASSGLVITGTGNVILGAANTHSGITYAGGGSTLVLKNQLALQSSELSMNHSSIVFDSSVSGNEFTLGGLSSPYSGAGYDIALQNNAGSPAAVALTVNQASASTYAGVLSGTGSLIKNGAGVLTLSGLNTYTGGTTINAGTLALSGFNDWGLGGGGPNGNVQVTINSPGTLRFEANNMRGDMTLNGGTVVSNNGFASTWDGTVDLQSTSTLNTSVGALWVPAVISGTGGLTKSGNSFLVLSNANTFSGNTRNNAGMFLLAHPLALQNSILDATNSVNGGQDIGFRTSVNALTLGGLSGTKNLASIFTTGNGGSFSTNLNNPAVQTFVVPVGGYRGLTSITLNPGTGITPSYSGIIADGAPGMSVVKTGAGTQTLSGANSYTGSTAVIDGTLALGAANTLPDVSAVSIRAATLDAATFADTVGTLDVTAAATINLGSGAALAFANSSAVSWTGGTLNITGTLGATSLRFGTTSSGLTPAQLALITVNGTGTYTLDASGYLVPSAGGSAYDTWKADNAPGSNPDDDTDGDGVPNAVEFIIGGTSFSKDLDKLPVVNATGTNFTVTFQREVSSIDPKTALFIETSTDLVTWNIAPSPYTVPDAVVTNNPGVSVAHSSIGFHTITLTVPKGLDAKKFARLKVVITP